MAGHSSISAERWLVGVMASVVLAFLVSTVTSQELESAIADRAHDIAGNAMPSVELLATARGHLHRVERQLDNRAEADAARQDAEVAILAYATIPYFPGERALYRHVVDALAVLDRDRTAYDDRASPPPDITTLRRDFALADQALQRVITFDAVQSQRLGFDIERMRGRSEGVVVLLDACSVALAMIAVVLALRQVRRTIEARARREAELAAQTESLGQFAGRVAHDVLSPLATVSLAFDLLRPHCEGDKAAARTLDRGVSSVHRVHGLVDGLLAFARAGGRPEPGTATELAPALGALFDELAPQAEMHRISLTVAPVPAGAIACSPGVFASLVSNLVRNAVKYMGDATERRIDVRVMETGAANWRVEVSDTGPGIPEDQQQRIFEPYVQIARGSGIGLGLATVDRLARAHGGSVGVRSRPGAGACFWFEIPSAVTHAFASTTLRATSSDNP